MKHSLFTHSVRFVCPTCRIRQKNGGRGAGGGGVGGEEEEGRDSVYEQYKHCTCILFVRKRLGKQNVS